MTIFSAIGISATGLTVHRKWMDAVSDNLANMNNASATNEVPFRERFVIATSVNAAYGTPPLEGRAGQGVMVGGIELGDAEGRMVYEPDHPLADKEGNVLYPDIDLGGQMTALLMSQRGYQANLAVVDRAKTAYEGAINLGRNT